jgi:uncharacterized protein (UPF0276 family)
VGPEASLDAVEKIKSLSPASNPTILVSHLSVCKKKRHYYLIMHYVMREACGLL